MTEVKTLGVVGAGQMGQGIAQVAAQAGYRRRSSSTPRPTSPQAGIGKIKKQLDRLVEKGKLDGRRARRASSALTPRPDSSRSRRVRLRRSRRRPRTTSSSSRSSRASASCARPTRSSRPTRRRSRSPSSRPRSGRPDRVIGMHFMNPVPLMKLVEIVRGLPTTDATYADRDRARRSASARPRSARATSPGFIVNRMLIPLLNEACFALYEGLGTADGHRHRRPARPQPPDGARSSSPI